MLREEPVLAAQQAQLPPPLVPALALAPAPLSLITVDELLLAEAFVSDVRVYT